jgi:hypothetical protein
MWALSSLSANGMSLLRVRQWPGSRRPSRLPPNPPAPRRPAPPGHSSGGTGGAGPAGCAVLMSSRLRRVRGLGTSWGCGIESPVPRWGVVSHVTWCPCRCGWVAGDRWQVQATCRPRHICAGTALTRATSAPGLRRALPFAPPPHITSLGTLAVLVVPLAIQPCAVVRLVGFLLHTGAQLPLSGGVGLHRRAPTWALTREPRSLPAARMAAAAHRCHRLP